MRTATKARAKGKAKAKAPGMLSGSGATGGLISYGEFTWMLKGLDVDLDPSEATVTYTVDHDWTEDSDGYRYTVTAESPDGSQDLEDGCDDYAEARGLVAATIKDVRQAYAERQAEADAAELAAACDALACDGKAGLALKALRAAGLI